VRRTISQLASFGSEEPGLGDRLVGAEDGRRGGVGSRPARRILLGEERQRAQRRSEQRSGGETADRHVALLIAPPPLLAFDAADHGVLRHLLNESSVGRTRRAGSRLGPERRNTFSAPCCDRTAPR
jgi:hypothetical protein